MSETEINEIRKHLSSIQSEMKENTKLTREGFDKIGDRVSKLEVAEAKRQGREEYTAPPVNWTKIVLAIIGVATASIALALTVAQGVLAK